VKILTRPLIILVVLLLLVGCDNPRGPAPTSTAQTTFWPTEAWQISTPEQQGLDSAQLAQMFVRIKDQGLNLHSLLVIRNGFIVVEAYFNPYGQSIKHELYSVTKSFTSALVGIAIDKGIIDGVDHPVQDFFTGQTFANTYQRKSALKLRHLLTMTSGLDWQEGDPIYQQMYRSNDWVQFVLDTPMAVEPGSRFVYCSGCSHVLSAIVHKATGMNTLEFARTNLFGPLGISDVAWETDSNGIPIGGWGLKIMPRDMAKLGYLYLNNGIWDEKQVISTSWVKASVQKLVETDSELGYGYQWWVYPRFGAYTALGRYGQTIFVIPESNLVIVTTAAIQDHQPIFDLIEDYIVPAVRSPGPLPENPKSQAELNALITALGER